jgi:hypothetical protein
MLIAAARSRHWLACWKLGYGLVVSTGLWWTAVGSAAGIARTASFLVVMKHKASRSSEQQQAIASRMVTAPLTK